MIHRQLHQGSWLQSLTHTHMALSDPGIPNDSGIKIAGPGGGAKGGPDHLPDPHDASAEGMLRLLCGSGDPGVLQDAPLPRAVSAEQVSEPNEAEEPGWPTAT